MAQGYGGIRLATAFKKHKKDSRKLAVNHLKKVTWTVWHDMMTIEAKNPRIDTPMRKPPWMEYLFSEIKTQMNAKALVITDMDVKSPGGVFK